MTHTPTPAEIETLRHTAGRHARNCTFGVYSSNCSCRTSEALAILDRLSPPAPEVDEATRAFNNIMGRYHSATLNPAMRDSACINILRELIASKDAEIAECHENINLKAKFIDDTLNDCAGQFERAEKAESALAALRAELSCCSLAAARRRGQLEKIREYFSNQDSPDATEFVRLIDCGFEHDRAAHAALKTAERNTDTTPEVVVTQGVWSHVKSFAFEDGRPLADLFASGNDKVNFCNHILALCTEAEARGRQEALEEAACVMDNLCFFTPIDELREMTKQEMSVRACREGAAAIRNLIREKRP